MLLAAGYPAFHPDPEACPGRRPDEDRQNRAEAETQGVPQGQTPGVQALHPARLSGTFASGAWDAVHQVRQTRGADQVRQGHCCYSCCLDADVQRWDDCEPEHQVLAEAPYRWGEVRSGA